MPESQFPYFVDWAITAKCNLSCRHCRGMSKGELSTERAKKLEVHLITNGMVEVPLLLSSL